MIYTIIVILIFSDEVWNTQAKRFIELVKVIYADKL